MTKRLPDNPQDIGGALSSDAADVPLEVAIQASTKPFLSWEWSTHALVAVLGNKGFITDGEFRRGIEQLPTKSYFGKTYYEKWAATTTQILLERGLLGQADFDTLRLGKVPEHNEVL